MTDEQKEKVIESLKKQLPGASEDRIKSVLSIIMLEIESYNTCKKTIDWDKMADVVTEILFQTMKSELDQNVTSVRRGDTTISYTSTNEQIRSTISDYKDLIKRLIGCGEVYFY